MSSTDNFLKIKNASQNISAKFFVSEVFHKNVFFNVLLMIMSVQFMLLLSKSSGLQRKHPLPLQCGAGGGVVVALFSLEPRVWLWL
jgi:hypothetical protein